MLEFLRNNRIGVKYTLITLALLIVLAVLASQDVLGGLEDDVNKGLEQLADYGLIGMFLIGLFSNMTLVIIVPYVLPMLTLVPYADSLTEVILLGAATGLGGGIGETASYAVAHAIVARVDDLSKSALFQWTKQAIDKRPHVIPFLVWLVSAVPLPDISVIVPLAMINYPWRKMVLPMITGKIVQNVSVALLFRYATSLASGLVSRDVNVDLSAGIMLLFIIVVAYQVEKARSQGDTNRPKTAPLQGLPQEKEL